MNSGSRISCAKLVWKCSMSVCSLFHCCQLDTLLALLQFYLVLSLHSSSFDWSIPRYSTFEHHRNEGSWPDSQHRSSWLYQSTWVRWLSWHLDQPCWEYDLSLEYSQSTTHKPYKESISLASRNWHENRYNHNGWSKYRGQYCYFLSVSIENEQYWWKGSQGHRGRRFLQKQLWNFYGIFHSQRRYCSKVTFSILLPATSW